MIETLYEVDLAFIVDTTGSMGSFLDVARRQMVDALSALGSEKEHPVNLRVGIVEYRDHPPQDVTFVARAHPFQSDLKQVQRTINGLKAEGGGDAPEAVFDGLRAAGEELAWRPHACRLAMLIGDAPPHGVGCGGDHFHGGCPCGLTVESTSAVLESRGLTLYAVGLTPTVERSFGRIASLTGGGYYSAAQAKQSIDAVVEVVRRELSEIDFDRQVLAWCRTTPDWNIDGLGTQLSASRGKIAESLSRLGRRGFFHPNVAEVEPTSEKTNEEPKREGRLTRTLKSMGRKLFGSAD